VQRSGGEQSSANEQGMPASNWRSQRNCVQRWPAGHSALEVQASFACKT
jgi:hypothetical protein